MIRMRSALIAIVLLAAPLLASGGPADATHGMFAARYVTGSWTGFFGLIAQCQGPGGVTPYGIGGACMMDPVGTSFRIRVTDDALGPIPFFWEARDNDQDRCPATGGTQQGFAHNGVSEPITLQDGCTHVTVFPDIVATQGWVRTEAA